MSFLSSSSPSLRRRWIPAFAGMTVFLVMSVAQAQTAPSSTPVNITADSLEYHENDHTYVARGNAEVVQGAVTIKAALLTAHYVEDAGGKSSVTQVLGEGGVTSNQPAASAAFMMWAARSLCCAAVICALLPARMW